MTHPLSGDAEHSEAVARTSGGTRDLPTVAPRDRETTGGGATRTRWVGPLLGLASLCVALAVAEVTLWLAAPVADPYESLKVKSRVNRYIKTEFLPNLRLATEAEPGLPGVHGRKLFSLNNMGFRGDSLADPKPADEYRILLVGGSTLECFYLDDSEAINSVLQEELRRRAGLGKTIRVYNAGVSGARSDDHISMIGHRIAHLEPDLIVVLAGVNDLRAFAYGLDYLHRGVDSTQGDDERISGRLLVQMLATEFQLPRRIHQAAKRSRPRTAAEILEEVPVNSNYGEKVALRRSARVAEGAPPTDVRGYMTNLRAMVGLTRAVGAQLVFLTQQTTWNTTIDPAAEAWQWLQYYDGITYDADLMDAAMTELNDGMRRVAQELHVPLYDLVAAIPKSTEFFYDDVHFNVRGAATAAKGLASFLLDRRLVTTHAAPQP